MEYLIEVRGKTKKQVTKLNLSGRKLTSIPDTVFEFTNLTKLILSNNMIKTIPKEILSLQKLKVLDLANNKIHVLQSAVFKLPKLRTLNVYGNQIKKFPKQISGSSIKRIIVGKNPLEEDELSKLKAVIDVVYTKGEQIGSKESKESVDMGTKNLDPSSEKPVVKKNSIFISYSHKDEKWLEQTRTHLKPLKRYYDIDLWDDRRLRAGDKWKEEISKALNDATIAVLLFSSNFIASDFIVNNELQPLLDNAKKKGTRIIPVMVSPCEIFKESGLSEYQAINTPEKTLVEMSEGEAQRTLSKLVKEIKSLTQGE